jgi:hypothetical protein
VGACIGTVGAVVVVAGAQATKTKTRTIKRLSKTSLERRCFIFILLKRIPKKKGEW